MLILFAHSIAYYNKKFFILCAADFKVSVKYDNSFDFYILLPRVIKEK